MGLALVGVGSRAERGYEAAAELAPVGEHGRQNLTDFGGAKMQEAVTAPVVERSTNLRREHGIERRGVVLRHDRKTTVGCERQGEAKLRGRGRHVCLPPIGLVLT